MSGVFAVADAHLEHFQRVLVRVGRGDSRRFRDAYEAFLVCLSACADDFTALAALERRPGFA